MALSITRPSDDIIVTGDSSDIFEDIWTEDQSQGWGVFSRLVEGLYASTEIVVFGDATTPTDVTDIDCCVKFDDSKYFYVRDNAEVTLGEKLDSETAINGCSIFFNDPGAGGSEIEMKGTLNLYNTSLKQISTGEGNKRNLKLNGAGEFIDSQLRFLNAIDIYTVYTQYNVKYSSLWNGIRVFDSMTFTNVETKNVLEGAYNFFITGDGKTNYFINPKIGGGSFFYDNTGWHPGVRTVYVRNYTPTLTWRGDASMNVDSRYYQQQPFNIHVRDKDGNNLSGVTCLLEDTDSVEAFSASTAGDGTITQQWVNYKTYDSTNYTTGGDTKSPHKLTLTKANYETLVIDEITMDELKDLEYELLPALAVGDVTFGTVFGESKVGTFNRNLVTGATITGQSLVGTIEGESTAGKVIGV